MTLAAAVAVALLLAAAARATPPSNSSLPTITGIFQQGETLTASTGDWLGTAPITYAYQWQRCTSQGSGCSNITGATDSIYNLVSADVGLWVRVTVTATNADGSASASSLSAQVTLAPVVNLAPPLITGTAQQGQVLTATSGNWSGAAPITYGYQWQRAPSAYFDAVWKDSPTGYWRFSEHAGATIAEDFHGSDGANYTTSGITFDQTGALSNDTNTAILLNGSTGYAAVPDSNNFHPGDTFSLEAWVKLTVLSSTQTIIGKGTNGFALRVSATGALSLSKENIVDLGKTSDGVITTGSWYHIVAVKNGTANPVAFYVNGVQKPLNAVDNRQAVQDTTNEMTFGRYASAWIEYLNGRIDEVAIYDQPLSLAQAQDHYNASLAAPTWTDIAGATSSSYTVAAADVGKQLQVRVTASNSVGSTSSTSKATDRVTDGSPVALSEPLLAKVPASVGQTVSLSSTGTWSGAAISSYAYQWQRCTSYATTVAADTPAGYWRLGEASGAFAFDSSGAGNDGDYGNQPTLGVEGGIAGDPDTAGSFDGFSNYVALPTTASYPSGRSAGTVEAWIKTSNTQGGTIAGWGDGTGAHDFFLAAGTPGSGGAQIQIDGATYIGTTILAASRWYHLVAVDDGSNLKLYVNGVLDGTFSPPPQFQKGNGAGQIGRFATTASDTYFKGTIDDVSFYSTALSLTQVQAHYNAAFAFPVCSDIAGATSATYTYATPADVKKQVRVKLTATNTYGTGSTESAPSPLVSSGSPSANNSTLPLVTGTATQGQTLSSTTGTFSGTGPFSYAYQWQRSTSSYATTVMTDGPTGYWRLGESSTITPALDLAVGGNGSYVGGAPTKGALNGDLDSAFSFDGIGDYVKLPNLDKSAETPPGATYPTGRNAATIEAWIKPQAFGDGSAIAGWGKDTTLAQSFFLAIAYDGTTARLEMRSGAAQPLVASSYAVSKNVWQHVVLVDTGSAVLIYANGTLVLNAPGTGGFDKQNGIARIGRYLPSLASNSFNGAIDEVAFYDRALSSTQISAHYNAKSATPAFSDISGATAATYALGSSDVAKQLRVRVTATSSAGSATATSAATAPVSSPALTLDSPSDKGGVHALKPVLTANTLTGATDYAFEVSTDKDFANIVDFSGWRVGTNSFSVSDAAKLQDDRTYYWRARARLAGSLSGWSAGRSFKVSVQRLGVRDFWPIWQHGPLAVNEASGNLIASLPGPSYPTALGSMGVSLVYNSQETKNNFDLGKGWTLVGGEAVSDPPVRLIDHSLLTDPLLDTTDALELIWADGSSIFYNHIGGSNVYQSTEGDNSDQVKKNGDNTYTLIDSSGAIYNFGVADVSNGAIASLGSFEVASAGPGLGKLTYTYVPSATKPRLTQIADPAGRTVTINWIGINAGSCAGTGALLCVTGPDGVQWKYLSDASYRVTTVYDGTRNLYTVSYDGNGRLNKVQNANDLNPGQASPGYNGSHAVGVSYDGSGRAATVTDGPITNQQGNTTSTWSFAYTASVSTTAPVQPNHMGVKTVGYTTLTPPRQQGQSCPTHCATVYYDELDHPVKTVDLLGRTTLAAYNEKDQLLWSENQESNPVDNTYDAVLGLLTKTEAPDADGIGPMGRPTTTYRYDEQQIGDANNPGAALQGLQAAYYSNVNLGGRPVLQTDAKVDYNWSNGGPAALGGQTNAFSVRWSGYLNVPADCDYTFSTLGDEGTMLTVDDLSAIYNWGVPGSQAGQRTASSRPISLTTGLHKIVLDYYDATGPAEIHLRWAYTNCASTVATQVIPNSVLQPAWLNRTSTVSPANRTAFTHFADPDAGHPDYTLAKLADGTNVITSFSYDSYGRVTQKVMPKGNAGRTISSSGSLSGAIDTTYATSYSFYASGATAAPPAACGGSSVNQAQLLKSVSPHGIAAATTVYDNAGRPVASSNGRGTSCLSYDGEGRLTSKSAPGDTQATTYSYDPAGAQRTASDASGTLTTAFDEAGRPKSTTDSFGATATFVYDADGNRVSRSAGPSGSSYTTIYAYNDADQLTSMTDPASRVYSFYYCPCGRLKAIQYPSGTFSWSDPNPDGWTTAVYNRHGTLPGTLPGSVPADSIGSPIADYSYAYSIEGQKTQEIRSGGGLTTETTSYVYDALGRLSQATLPSGVVRAYNFDLDSNRTSIVENNSTVSTYSYNPAVTAGVDQLTSVTSAGNTTNYTYTADGQAKTRGNDALSWDGSGRHSGGTFSGTTISYSFDATGFRRQRVSGTTTTRYLLAGLFETDGGGTLTLSAIDALAGDLAHYVGAPATLSAVSFKYYNDHGDLAAETDLSGTRTAAYTYDPFGGLRSGSAPANATTERWVGRHDKKLDSASGLTEMGVRPYDPNTGRFLAVDPVEGGSLNTYDYAGEDPINVYDLLGASSDSDQGWHLCGIVFADGTGKHGRDEFFVRVHNDHPFSVIIIKLVVRSLNARSWPYSFSFSTGPWQFFWAHYYARTILTPSITTNLHGDAQLRVWVRQEPNPPRNLTEAPGVKIFVYSRDPCWLER